MTGYNFWKRLFTVAFLGLLPGFTGSASAQVRVEVVIENVRDTAGVIRVAMFRDAETFMKKPFRSASVKAEKGRVLVALEAVPPGTYAVSLIHDANRNGKLDSNFIGIPREGFGFSNDALGKFGPPTFEKAKVSVHGGNYVVLVQARYY